MTDYRAPARRITYLIMAVGIVGLLVGWLVQQETFLTFLTSQIFWMGLIWLIVGFIAWLLLQLMGEPEVAPGSAEVARVRAAQAVPAATTSMAAASAFVPSTPKPAASTKDDLKRIEGIGPKVEDALNKSGIQTWRQVAETSAEELYRIVKIDHGVQIVGNTATNSWPEQARLLADGRFEEFEALVARLTAGR